MSLFEEASRYIAGGVNSAGAGVSRRRRRAASSSARARGAAIETEDGRRFIDYVGSWGPMILGHADPDVIAAVVRRAQDGLSFGAPTLIETELARRITELVPSIELVAHGELRHRGDDERDPPGARLHRARTHREIRGLLPRPLGRPSREGRLGRPHARRARFRGRAGGDRGRDDDALPYNDVAALEACFTQGGREIACVIVEPVAGNMGCVPPAAGFLEILARALHAPRRGAHLRRSDDGFSRRARRRAGALWRQTGPHDARQDRRRRHAGRRVRRTARHHGKARTARARLPGGHPVGQPGCDGGGTRDARGRCETGLSRAPRRHDDAPLSRVWPARRARPAFPLRPRTSAACSASSLRPRLP